MTSSKQFWALVKFQFSITPSMWFLPLVIGGSSITPFLIQGNSTFHSGLSFFFTGNQYFFFVGIFGSMILAPEKFQFTGIKTTVSYSGTEFLLTRAVDRPVLFRAKAFLLYTLILLPPVCALAYFQRTPELIVQESSKIETQRVLDHVPDAVSSTNPVPGLQPNIHIPYGNLFIIEGQLWMLLMAIILLQILITILSPFKFGKTLFWTLCYLGLLVPAFLPLYNLKNMAQDQPSPMESLFYFFVGHQPTIWVATVVCIMVCQIFCERDFTRQEQ